MQLGHFFEEVAKLQLRARIGCRQQGDLTVTLVPSHKVGYAIPIDKNGCSRSPRHMSRLAALCLWFVLSLSWPDVQLPSPAGAGAARLAGTIAEASTTAPTSTAKAAIDGNRFATE